MIQTETTILIVDDHPSVRKILSRILETQGYQVVTAGTGQEALQRAKESRPDVVLLDILMPGGMNGYEVCQRLREDPLLTDVPILMITALDDRESRLHGIESGADDFITKPFDPIEIQARVNNITRLNRYRRLIAGELKFEWVVEESDEGYLIVNQNDTIVYANTRARIFLNLPHNSRIPTEYSFFELASQIYNYEPKEAWENWPRTNSEESAAARYLIRPESPQAYAFWLQVSTLEMNLGSETMHVLRLRDVTERMSSKHDVWKLHGMIFHKLRTPFMTLLGSLDLLHQYSHDMTPDKIHQLSGTATYSAQHLHQIIEDVLKFVEAPALPTPNMAFELSNMAKLISRISDNLEIEKVSFSMSPELEQEKIALPEDSFEMIIWEVLQNSKKFHPEQTPEIEVSVTPTQKKHISVRICDNGVSLPPEQLIAVWQPYYQGEKYFTGQMAGAGLGLTAVASLTWQVGGQYQISNREDIPGIVVELIFPPLKAK